MTIEETRLLTAMWAGRINRLHSLWPVLAPFGYGLVSILCMLITPVSAAYVTHVFWVIVALGAYAMMTQLAADSHREDLREVESPARSEIVLRFIGLIGLLQLFFGVVVFATLIRLEALTHLAGPLLTLFVLVAIAGYAAYPYLAQKGISRQLTGFLISAGASDKIRPEVILSMTVPVAILDLALTNLAHIDAQIAFIFSIGFIEVFIGTLALRESVMLGLALIEQNRAR